MSRSLLYHYVTKLVFTKAVNVIFFNLQTNLFSNRGKVAVEQFLGGFNKTAQTVNQVCL